MNHIASFALFENNMQEALYAESAYLNSPEGKDLAAINRYGYRLPRTGKFFISERYSEYRIQKNSSGKWTAVTTTKAKIDLGEFNTPEECFRRIWSWIIIKKGIPTGATIKEYTDWLMDPSCPVWGKQLSLSEIEEEYIKTLRSSSPELVTDLTGIFSGPKWKEAFDLIGVHVESIGIASADQSKPGTPNYASFQPNPFFARSNPSSPFYALWHVLDSEVGIQGARGSYTSSKQIHIPGFSVSLSLRKEYKVKSDKVHGNLTFKIGDTSLETMENKIMTRYLKQLAKTQIDIKKNGKIVGKSEPGEHPLLVFLISVLSGNGIPENLFRITAEHFAEEVRLDPLLILNIPEPYAKEVAKIVGLTDNQVSGIRKAQDIGIF